MTDTSILDTVLPETGGYDPSKIAGEQRRVGALSQVADTKREAAMKAYRGSAQDTVAAIEGATQALKKSREDQWNLPAMAFASGMLHTTPGVAGNFASELSQGLGAMVPTIARQRMTDQEFYTKMAELQAEKGKIAGAPEKVEAEYQGKLSAEAQKLVSQLAMAGAKLTKPIPIPGVPGRFLMLNPQTGKYEEITAGGSGAAAPGAIPTKVDIPTNADDKTVLQTVLGKEYNPESLPYYTPDFEKKLAAAARGDQAHARRLWDIINYREDPEKTTDSRGLKIDRNELLAQAKALDPTFDTSGYAQYRKAKIDWDNGPDAKSITSAKTGVNHIGDLMELGAALKNNDWTAINSIFNKISTSSGTIRAGDLQAFKVNAKLAGDEIAKYIGGSGAVAQGSKDEIAGFFNDVSSPEALQRAIRQTVKLLNGKMEPMAEQKQQALGNRRRVSVDDLLGDSTGERFKKVMSTDITTPEGRAAWGHPDKQKVWPKPSAEAIERLKTKKDADSFDSHFGPGAAARALGQ